MLTGRRRSSPSLHLRCLRMETNSLNRSVTVRYQDLQGCIHFFLYISRFCLPGLGKRCSPLRDRVFSFDSDPMRTPQYKKVRACRPEKYRPWSKRSRLASYLISYKIFQIEVTRLYRLQEFREGNKTLYISMWTYRLNCVTCFLSHLVLDIRKLYYLAGVENKPTVFLFNDTQVVEESFLEDINNILSSGEVPNLYKPDEFEEVHIDDVYNTGCS